jgi:drug/metabolite transporter (DMT)-like permease
MCGRARAGSVGAVPGVAPLLAAAIAFGTVSVLARRAYELGSHPASLLGVRLLVAAVLLSGLCARCGVPRVGPRELAIGAAAGVAFAAAGLGEFEALSRAPAPTVVLLVFVAPVWVALALWVAGHGPPGWPTAAALALILGGLALLLGVPGGNGLDPDAAALALGASVMSALFFVVVAELTRKVQPLAAACMAAWSAALATLALEPAGIAHELSRSATAGYGIVIGCLTACALGLLATGLRGGSALWASAVIGVEPLVAAALSALVLGEFLSGAQLGGAAAVLAGVTAMSVLTGPAPPSPAATGRTRRRPRESRPRPRPARTARPRQSEDRSPGSRG